MSKNNVKDSAGQTGKILVIISTLLFIFLFILILIYISGSSILNGFEYRLNIWDKVETNLGENSFLLGSNLKNKITIKDFVMINEPDKDIFKFCTDIDEKINCGIVPLKQKNNFEQEILINFYSDWTEETFFDRFTGKGVYLVDTTKPEELEINVNTQKVTIKGYGVSKEHLEEINFCYNELQICGRAYLKDNQDITKYGYRKFSNNLKEVLKSINLSSSTKSEVEEYTKLYSK